MKALQSELVRWSKDTHSNIFKKVERMEDLENMKEVQLEMNNSKINRLELRSDEKELMQLYKIEEEYWKQKVGMACFKDGDRNTKFFHSHVKGRTRKLIINEIINYQDVTLQEAREISDETNKVFTKQFTEQGTIEDYFIN